MSKHQIISAERAAAEHAMKLHLMQAVEIASNTPGGQKAIGEALCAALDTVAAGAPRYHMMADMREEALFWADMATPLELEVYAATALRRVGQSTLAERARKRLFWALWGSMAQDAKAAFLARVEREQAPP